MEGVSGLASGIDTAGIIDALKAADRRPIQLLENKRTLLEARLEAVRGLNTRMLDLDLEGLALRRASTFGARQVSASDDGVASGKANSAVATGTYAVTVNSIAQAHQIATQATVADQNAASYSGTIDLTVGGSSTQVALEGTVSLSEVVSAINNSGAGVRASLINVGNETTPSYRMLLQARQTGQDYAIADVVGSSGGGLDTLFGGAALSGFDTVQAASDTSVSVTVGSGPGAITATGTSNTSEVKDLVAGLTVNAQAVGSTTLTVSADTAVAKEAISGFLESLNAALDYHTANATYDANTNEAGVLFSENDLRSGINNLKRTLLSSSPNASTYKTLAGIGITYNNDTGRFDLDEAALDAALGSDPQGVADLFVQGGLGQRIDDSLSRMTQSIDGVLAAKDKNISDSIIRINDRVDDLESRLDLRVARYQAEFLTMEKLISQYQSTGNFISGQIEGFSNLAASASGRGN